MLNKFVVQGRFVDDPRMSKTANGKPYVYGTIACNRTFKDKETGERKADFFDYVAWGKMAELVSEYGAKGRMVIFDGTMENRDWTDENGKVHRKIQMRVQDVILQDNRDTRPARNDAEGYTPVTEGYSVMADDDEVLPF